MRLFRLAAIVLTGLLAALSLGLASQWFKPAIAQTDAPCFLQQTNGTTIDLTNLCSSTTLTAPTVDRQAQSDRASQMALQQMQSGQTSAAIDSLTQVIAVNPTLADAYYERGALHMATGNAQAAIADWQQAARLYRSSGEANQATDLQAMITQFQE